MYAKRFEETPGFVQFGNTYRMLLPRDLTESMESALVRMEKGSRTPRHSHKDEEQMYIILEGKGLLRIGDDEKEIEKDMVAYIPRGKEHEVISTGNDGLSYIYIAVWPEGIPKDEKEWEKAYKVKDEQV